MTAISIIIPTLNESSVIADTLQPLQSMRTRGQEIILVDGGSDDATPDLARPYVDKIMNTSSLPRIPAPANLVRPCTSSLPRIPAPANLVRPCTSSGRARQMNQGALNATGNYLWFLHADTQVPDNADQLILRALDDGKSQWGYFDVRLSGKHPLLRMVETSMNLRTRLTGIATGDQGIFITKETFLKLGGFANIPLMEDIELCRRLKKHHRPTHLHTKLITSSRRWEENGILKTISLMWRLRLAYTLGADPHKLAALYR